MKNLIKQKYGSISALARALGVSRNAVYKALNGDPHMHKLLEKIKELLND